MDNIIEFKKMTRKTGEKAKEKSGVMSKTLRDLSGKTSEDILELYGDANGLPIDIEKIVHSMGIRIVDVDFAELEDELGISKGYILGATIADGESAVIFYRENSSENRKRFTIAHEIAHCCLHTDSLMEQHVEFRDNNRSNISERERMANIFAGELLIPKKQLDEAYSQMLFPKLSTLVQIFKVSTSVMAARLDYLNLNYYKDMPLNEG